MQFIEKYKLNHNIIVCALKEHHDFNFEKIQAMVGADTCRNIIQALDAARQQDAVKTMMMLSHRLEDLIHQVAKRVNIECNVPLYMCSDQQLRALCKSMHALDGTSADINPSTLILIRELSGEYRLKPQVHIDTPREHEKHVYIVVGLIVDMICEFSTFLQHLPVHPITTDVV